MMISPKTYIETLKKDSYEELILKRDHLMDSIRQFEELERKGNHSGKEWRINPSPEVRYQSNLDYLSELCAFMRNKYCEEYVWGDKNLSDDTEVE